jgi:hypothetical protein
LAEAIIGVTAYTFLSIETTRSAVRYGKQASSALYTVLGTRPSSSEDQYVSDSVRLGLCEPPNFSRDDRDDLIDRAIRSGDEHAIRFTEASLAEFTRSPSAIYLRAVDHAITLLTIRT